MMSRTRAACVIVGAMILTACVDKKPQATDTSTSISNAPATNEHVDTVRTMLTIRQVKKLGLVEL